MVLSFAALEERRAAQNKPFRALLELTHRCNFRCVHCYESNHERTDELSTDEWKHVIDELRAAGVLFLTFSGGEFSLRPDALGLMAYARAAGFYLRVFSNAAVLTERVMRQWAKDCAPHEVEVSVYGASAATYQAVTGAKNGYEQMVAGLERLYRDGYQVRVKVVVLRENVHEVAEMRALGERFGFRVSVSGKLTVRDDGSLEPLAHQVSDEDWKSFDDHFEENRLVMSSDADGRPCNAGRSSLSVGPNGDVYACVDMRVSLGNLMTRSLMEIWEGRGLLQSVRAVRNRDFLFPERMDYSRARAPCMAENLMNTGTLVQIRRPRTSAEVSQQREEGVT